MIFSSVPFLMIFLVIVLVLYYLPFRKKHIYRNILLLFSSLFFYAWGEREAVFVLIFSIIINWGAALFMDRMKAGFPKRLVRDLIVFFDILILFVYKYLAFTLHNIGLVLDKPLDYSVELPIGISFYTFQIISYILDLYKGQVLVQKNPLNLGLYVSLFPQLIAGPIVRYKTVEEEIENRVENFEDFKQGFFRFVWGLSKKVLIANSVASLADAAFGMDERSVLMAWLGAVAYTIQIFFDFSGYSDMAIGLGRIFGFHFEENFNYPYISSSITEFWRRWHISLSGWFRDYVYIPLGGSRKGKLKTYRNIFVVWLLTGIWHGANWTFIVWGLMYFVLLVIEKNINIKKLPAFVTHIYTMLFVILGWVIFRADSLKDAFVYIGNMFGIGVGGIFNADSLVYLSKYCMYLILGIVCCFPVKSFLEKTIKPGEDLKKAVNSICVVILFVICLAFIISSDYDPFIYFNF